MGTTISIASGRRQRAAKAVNDLAPSPAHTEAPVSAPAHPLVGVELGTVERRYGLVSSKQTVRVADVVATSGDLAVADRLAYAAAVNGRSPLVVVQSDGWYVACLVDPCLDVTQLLVLQGDAGAPTVMSVVTDRGITPLLGPLVA